MLVLLVCAGADLEYRTTSHIKEFMNVLDEVSLMVLLFPVSATY